jgi:hypothetical protein
MRGLALALAAALLLGACMSRPPRHDRSGEVSYNRRELPPEEGLFTGPDGTWTVYDNAPDREDPAPPRRTTPSCDEGQVCEPPAGDP